MYSLVRTAEVMELDYYQPDCNLFVHYRYYLVMFKIINQLSRVMDSADCLLILYAVSCLCPLC
jgi:hypothetical protein